MVRSWFSFVKREHHISHITRITSEIYGPYLTGWCMAQYIISVAKFCSPRNVFFGTRAGRYCRWPLPVELRPSLPYAAAGAAPGCPDRAGAQLGRTIAVLA